jgi:hypothetical protein
VSQRSFLTSCAAGVFTACWNEWVPSLVQNGPEQPWWLHPSGKRPRILNSYHDLRLTAAYGPGRVARISRAVWLYFRSISNQVAFHSRRESRTSLAPLLRDEIVIAPT